MTEPTALTKRACKDILKECRLRSDLTEDQKREALRIGRIGYVSAGAKRDR